MKLLNLRQRKLGKSDKFIFPYHYFYFGWPDRFAGITNPARSKSEVCKELFIYQTLDFSRGLKGWSSYQDSWDSQLRL
jgi:hypothetical protein